MLAVTMNQEFRINPTPGMTNKMRIAYNGFHE